MFVINEKGCIVPVHNPDKIELSELIGYECERNPDGTEHIASVEMVHLAFPRRVFTLATLLKVQTKRHLHTLRCKDVFGAEEGTRPFHGLRPRRPLLCNSTRLRLRS